MRLGKQFKILIYCSTASLVGAAFLVVAARSMFNETSPASREVAVRAAATGAPPAADRLAFVPRGSFVPQASLSDSSQATIDPEQSPAATGRWVTDIVAEPQPPSVWRSTLLPPDRAPPVVAPRVPSRRFYTIKSRLAEIAIPATARLVAKFDAAKAAWPPAQIVLIAIKDEKVLELHARPISGPWKLIERYRVLAASGSSGPKLRQGDRQVPEGIYGIESLNPNSAYHVSLRVNYPNSFDRLMAAKDGRKELGGDIMIHGKNLSAGCLAVGDEAVEELFLLAAQTGLQNIKLIIAPTDLREKASPSTTSVAPEWTPKLYTEIASAMSEFKAPRSTGLLSFFMK